MIVRFDRAQLLFVDFQATGQFSDSVAFAVDDAFEKAFDERAESHASPRDRKGSDKTDTGPAARVRAVLHTVHCMT